MIKNNTDKIAENVDTVKNKSPFKPNSNSALDWERVQEILEENKELLRLLAEDD